jgi:hypothetical protein
MRKTGRQEKRFSEQVLSCFLAFLMNPSGPLRLCGFAFQMPFGCGPAALGSLLFLLILLAAPSVAFGHRLDEYLQATLVAIEPGDIRLQMNLTPGVQVVDQVLARIDTDHDGAISAKEAAAYAESLKRDLIVRLDRRVLKLKLTAVNVLEPDELREGEGIIQLEFSVAFGPLRAGAHSLSIENRHMPDVSVYLLNAAKPKADSIQITGQKRNESQSAGEIGFTFRPRPNPYAAVGIDVLLGALFMGGMAWEWRAARRRSRA